MSLQIPASRRLLLAVSALGLAACGSDTDLASLRTQVVAEVPGATLTGADLERWLMASPEPPTALTASVLTSAWIDQALVAEAIRQQRDLSAPALVDSAIAVDAGMARIFEVFSDRNRAYPAITDAQADSLFDAGSVRVFQQILLKVTPAGDPEAQTQAGQRAELLRARAATTTDFTQLAREVSEDTEHAATGAFNPARTRDEMPPGQMGGHLWTLRPGDVSRVFTSGEIAIFFHRSGKEAARQELKRWLFPRQAGRADSLFTDSLVQANQTQVASGAVARVRSMAVEPVRADDGGLLVTWTGGGLSSVGAQQWLLALDPRQRADLALASDRDVEAVLMDMARRDQLLAYGGGTAGLNDSLRTDLRQRYQGLVGAFQQTYGSGDAGIPTRLMDSMTVANQAYLPVPRGLAGLLRQQSTIRVDHDLQQRLALAVAQAYAARIAETPTTPAPAPGTPPEQP